MPLDPDVIPHAKRIVDEGALSKVNGAVVAAVIVECEVLQGRVARLTAQLNSSEAHEQQIATLRAERDRAVDDRAFTHQFYAVRIQRLSDLAKERGIWPEVACILANGVGDVREPPTYAQMLNSALHWAEAAEKERDAAIAQTKADAVTIAQLREAVRTLRATAQDFADVLVADDADCTCEPGDTCPLCRNRDALAATAGYYATVEVHHDGLGAHMPGEGGDGCPLCVDAAAKANAS